MWRDGWWSLGFVVVSAVLVTCVVVKARYDAADPMRCAGLVAVGNRCCGPGQTVVSGRCQGRPWSCPAPLLASEGGCVAPDIRVALPGGTIQIGAGDWEAEGRVRAGTRAVASVVLDAFEITEAAYGACVEGGGCVPLPMSGEPGRALAGITRDEAEAYCRFRGGRLPSSDEWTLAAAGTRSRRYPWGDTGAVCRRGAWGLLRGPCGFEFDAPGLAGAHPDGATPEGVHDLAGNVSEWVTDGVDDSAPAEVSGAKLVGVPRREVLQGDSDPGSGEVRGAHQGSGEIRRGDRGGARTAPEATARAGEVRGGSYAVELATDLRTWMTRRVPVQVRSSEIGARCAYDAHVTKPTEAPPVVASPIP